MQHEGLTTGQAAKYSSQHPKTIQAMAAPVAATALPQKIEIKPASPLTKQIAA